MRIGPHRFDRVELAGSLGDLGTLIPLSIALVTVSGMGFTPIFLAFGATYVATGLFYRLPVPVQPLKLVAAVAIASPGAVTPGVLSATALVFGALFLVLAILGWIDRLEKVFTRPIVRGIQLGLGFVLVDKGIAMIADPRLFGGGTDSALELAGIPTNLLVGCAAAVIVLLLSGSSRLPAALVVVGLGLALGIPFGPLRGGEWSFGPGAIEWTVPAAGDWTPALFLLVLPQLPMTLANAVMGSTDAARRLFGEAACAPRVTNRNFSLSMGFANLTAGVIGAMPMCHGAGGLAGHYRFGARTGGATILLGAALAGLALILGDSGPALLASIPNAVLGVLLLFAGLELALLIGDVRERAELLVALLIAGVAVGTGNMGIAFVVGIVVEWILRRGPGRHFTGDLDRPRS